MQLCLQQPSSTQQEAARHGLPFPGDLEVSRSLPRKSEEDEVEGEAGAVGPG